LATFEALATTSGHTLTTLEGEEAPQLPDRIFGEGSTACSAP
jgi:hypothetical protein